MNKDKSIQEAETTWQDIRKKMQRNCPHLDNHRQWAFNLVHNFPDGLPRGLCPLCMLLIQPTHCESGGPNQIIAVAEHPLYPVVRWMEQLDYTLAKLEQEYIQKVDDAISFVGKRDHLFDAAEFQYADAIPKPWEEFKSGTQQYLPKPTTTEPMK